MKIKTFHFGDIEIDDDSIVHFPQGIPAFEDHQYFAFIQPDENIPFSYMQSVDHGELALVVTNPFLFYPDYEFELPESTKEELKIRSEEDVCVWAVVTVKGRLADATLNLLAPVVVNVNEKLGRQIILHDSGYRTKHRLIPEEQAAIRTPAKGDDDRACAQPENK